MSNYDGSVVFNTKLDTKEFDNTIKRMQTAATASFAVIGTAAAAGLGAAIKHGKNFDTVMSNVKAISGASAEEMELLTAKAEEMGSKTVFSAAEAAKALTYMAAAGWQTEDMLSGIEGVMNLASSSGEDLGLTADIVTGALTAFGLSASDSARFADVLAVTSAAANTNVALMGETFKYAAPIAGTLGYSIEDVSAAIGIMSNSSIKGSEAGTALNAILTRLSTNTSGAADTIRELGVDFFDSEGNARDFGDVIGELRDVTRDMTSEQKTALASTVAGMEASKGLLALLNSSKEDYDALTDAISKADGAAKSMSDTMTDDLGGDMAVMESTLESLGLRVYDCFEEPLRAAVQTATESISEIAAEFSDGELRDSFRNVGEEFSDLISDAAELAEGVLPGLANSIAFLIEHGEKLAVVTASWMIGKKMNKFFADVKLGWDSAKIKVAEYTAALEFEQKLESKGATVSNTVLTSMKTKEIIVGVLTGKISLLAAAQGLWNAAMSANPLGTILTLASLAVTAIGSLVSRITSAKDATDKLTETIKAQEEAYRRNVDTIKESVIETEAQTKRVTELVESIIELDDTLNDENRTAAENEKTKRLLAGVVEELTELAPELADALFDENGELRMQREEVEKLTKSYGEYAVAKAHASAYGQLYEEALYNQLQAEKTSAEQFAEYDDAVWSKRRAESAYQGRKDLTNHDVAFTGTLQRQYAAAAAAVEKEKTDWEKAENEVEKYKTDADYYYQKMTEYRTAAAETYFLSDNDAAGEREQAEKTLETQTKTQMSSDEALAAAEERKKDLRYELETDIISEAEYYDGLAGIRDEYFEKGSREWKNLDAEIYRAQKQRREDEEEAYEKHRENMLRETENAIREELSLLEYRRDTGKVTESEYYDELEKYRDKHFKENTEEWRKYDLQIYEGRKKLGENRLRLEREAADEETLIAQQAAENAKRLADDTADAVISAYSNIVAFADDAFADVESDADYLSQKLNAYGKSGLLTQNENGDTVLVDPLERFESLQEYAKNTVDLKERMKQVGIDESLGAEFFKLYSEMSVEEAEKMSRLLSEKSDKAFFDWFSRLGAIGNISDALSDTLYKDEYEKAVDETIEYMRKKFEDLGIKLPESFFESGTDAAEAFAESFGIEFEKQMNSLREQLGAHSPMLIGATLSAAGIPYYAADTNTFYETTKNYYFAQTTDTVYQSICATEAADEHERQLGL